MKLHTMTTAARGIRGAAPALLLSAALAAGCASASAGGPSDASSPAQAAAIAEATEGFERHDGFVPFHFNDETGQIYLEVERLEEDLLYLNSLATGIGSAALGLDRGTIGDEAVVRFERHGPRVFLVQQNPGFRATTENEDLKRSVRESFAVSVLGAFPIVASEDGRLLVDATDFFLQDAYGVAARIRRADQGDFRVDRDRSAVYEPRTKAFPENTEVEVLLTFSSDAPGREIRRHTPDGRSLSLRQHHSFVQLPPEGYEPRRFDPRLGLYPVTFYDFSRSLDEGYERRWIARHRLEKANPDAEMSAPVEPIVYYLDPGIPEPYRTAFREGALWWNEVFEAAGFENAFRVEDLPEGVDPMDARYNVIQWVHRTEPAFSIGPSYIDPRTGEIIKAAVRMDSHRSLVDFNIFAGARPAVAQGLGGSGLGDAGIGDWITSLDPAVDGEDFAMARRRQHAAHEVGHTLGLAHNFIAASYGRASVMDYPAPLIRLREDGSVDLTDAYRPGPGAYDTAAIRYAYTEYDSPEAEEAGLRAIVDDALEKGLRFVTGGDASGSGSIPAAHRWVNGRDMIEELDRVTEVREVLLSRFGTAAIRSGEPLSTLNERLAPVYLHHRYTLGAAIKALGGMDYRYALKGDGQTPTQIVSPARQWRALDRLVEALQPDALAIPDAVVEKIAPPPYGYDRGELGFDSPAGPAFDPLAAARVLSSMIVDGALHRERAARLVLFHARDPEVPGLNAVITQFVDGTWGAAEPAEPMRAALRRVAGRAVLDRLIALASDAEATVDVRAIAAWHLARLADRLEGAAARTEVERAFNAHAVRDIRRFLERDDAPTPRSEPVATPPGTPIGQRDGGAGSGSTR